MRKDKAESKSDQLSKLLGIEPKKPCNFCGHCVPCDKCVREMVYPDFTRLSNFVKLIYLQTNIPDWLGCTSVMGFASLGDSPKAFLNNLYSNLKNNVGCGKYTNGVRAGIIEACRKTEWEY